MAKRPRRASGGYEARHIFRARRGTAFMTRSLTGSWTNRIVAPALRSVTIGIVASATAAAIPAFQASGVAGSAVERIVPSHAKSWIQSASDDLSPLASALVQLLQTADDWQEGQASASSVAEAVQMSMPSFAAALHRLASLSGSSTAPSAKTDAIAAIDLYVAAFRLEWSATKLPVGALQQQLQLSFERIRELGDAVYDLATTIANGGTPTPLPPGTPNIRPADVPSWDALGLAAGPPLETDAPPAAMSTPPTYQVNRPQQPMRGWLRDVATSGIPPPAAVHNEVKSAHPGTLRETADATQGAVNALDGEADPDRLRSASTQTRLTLLVEAEALRAAEAARLTPHAASQAELQLEGVAKTLATISDSLWDTAVLGHRVVGFGSHLVSPGVLTAEP